MTSLGRRRSSAKQRSVLDPDDPASFNIRYDYSDTHFDNEELETQFEDQADEIYREKYRMIVETDEILKKAKQNADEMLQLKEKVNCRDPDDSSELVRSSTELRRRQPSLGAGILQSSDDTRTQHEHRFADDKTDKHQVSTLTNSKTDTGKQGYLKPLTDYTMFLLSIQRAKRPQAHPHQFLTEGWDKKRDKKKTDETDSKQIPKKRPVKSALRSKRSPEQHGSCEDSGKKNALYGIHVKKDFSRSRRELEEISRLEQDIKYGNVDRYEERRKRLLAKCKDTQSLQDRINFFLKDVDEFKLLCKKGNSVDKVLLRTKTSLGTRTSTFIG